MKMCMHLLRRRVSENPAAHICSLLLIYARADIWKGRFVPTRRTPAISTSDLLERIVRGYRDGFFDSKLEKNGHPELLAADVDWDSSASMEKREKRKAAHHHKVKK